MAAQAQTLANVRVSVQTSKRLHKIVPIVLVTLLGFVLMIVFLMPLG